MAALEKRASDTTAVDFEFASLWIEMLMRRDHPESYLANEAHTLETNRQNYRAHYPAAAAHVINVLEAALPSKSGIARDMAAYSIQLARDTTRRIETTAGSSK